MSATTSSTAIFIKEKEDVATTQQTASSLSTITIKDSGLPCFICTTSGEEEVLLVAALTSQISSQITSSINQTLKKPPTPIGSYSLNFLSSEQVALEIQIHDLLSDLGKQDASESSVKETTRNNSPFALFSSHTSTTKSFSPKTQESSTINTHQTHSETEQLETQSTLDLTTSIQLSKDSLHPTNSRTVTQASHQSKTQELQTKTPLPTIHNEPEKISEPLFTTKTLEQRNSKQNKDRQQQSHQDSKQDDNHKQHKQHVLKTEPFSKKSKTSLSVADLQYLAYSQAHKPFPVSKQMDKSALFQKKALSPIAMFAQTQKTTSEPEAIASNTENIFVRFMHLMARILGQAEAEAHELYLKVKARTDDVDALTLLLSKINNESDAINWEDQEDLKKLVDRAKELGVPIHDSYQWSVEEKKLLKENIIMRKENLEKITQLERTDMQRLLQEVSQCHQARSNVLKLLKELMDTFIYNLRP